MHAWVTGIKCLRERERESALEPLSAPNNSSPSRSLDAGAYPVPNTANLTYLKPKTCIPSPGANGVEGFSFESETAS